MTGISIKSAANPSRHLSVLTLLAMSIAATAVTGCGGGEEAVTAAAPTSSDDVADSSGQAPLLTAHIENAALEEDAVDGANLTTPADSKATIQAVTTPTAIKSNDHRARMVFDADLALSAQPSYLNYYTGVATGGYNAQFGNINSIPAAGLQVDGNASHKAFERVLATELGKYAFRTTIAKSYPRTQENTTRFTPGGAYSAEIGPGREVWCGMSFVPSVIADFGGIHGLHHVNTSTVGLTPYTLTFIPKAAGKGQFQLIARSTTTMNANGTWTLAPLDGGNPRATYKEYFFGNASPNEHHKLILNFRIGHDKQYQPFMKVWHKVGTTWQNSGNPVVDIANRPIGHNLRNQNHQLRPTGVYNWHPQDASSWPSAPNGIPAAGETGIRSLSRGGICLVAGAPNTGEAALSRDTVMAWLER